MFSHQFQLGETGMEVFSASGKDPTKNWKIVGGVHRVYDRTVKGFVFLIDKGIGTCLSCPSNSNESSLGLIQPLIIFQIRCSMSKPLSLEINILDQNNTRHRFHFSTKFRIIDKNELHTQLPLSIISKDKWNNLVINLRKITSQLFRNTQFKVIDSICIYSVCRIRKIFTMPYLDSMEPLIAESFQFVNSTDFSTQVSTIIM